MRVCLPTFATHQARALDNASNRKLGNDALQEFPCNTCAIEMGLICKPNMCDIQTLFVMVCKRWMDTIHQIVNLARLPSTKYKCHLHASQTRAHARRRRHNCQNSVLYSTLKYCVNSCAIDQGQPDMCSCQTVYLTVFKQLR